MEPARACLGQGAGAGRFAIALHLGPNDPVSGAHVLPEIEARLPGATLHVLDGLGHAPHMEAPLGLRCASPGSTNQSGNGPSIRCRAPEQSSESVHRAEVSIQRLFGPAL